MVPVDSVLAGAPLAGAASGSDLPITAVNGFFGGGSPSDTLGFGGGSAGANVAPAPPEGSKFDAVGLNEKDDAPGLRLKPPESFFPGNGFNTISSPPSLARSSQESPILENFDIKSAEIRCVPEI